MTSWFTTNVSDEDERAIRAFMMRVADVPLPARRAKSSDPSVLWIKGQLLRRWQAERRVQAPLDVMERLQIAAGLAAMIAMSIWAAPLLLEVVRRVHL